MIEDAKVLVEDKLSFLRRFYLLQKTNFFQESDVIPPTEWV